MTTTQQGLDSSYNPTTTADTSQFPATLHVTLRGETFVVTGPPFTEVKETSDIGIYELTSVGRVTVDRSFTDGVAPVNPPVEIIDPPDTGDGAGEGGGGGESGSESDEPDMSSVGTLFYSDDMERYSTATNMGENLNDPIQFMPNPAPYLNSTPVNTDEVEVITPGRGGTGQALRHKFSGVSGSSAKFMTVPENAGYVIPDNSTHYFQYYARCTSASPFFNGATSLAVKWFEMWFRHDSGRIQCNTRYGGSGAGGYQYPGHTTGWEIIGPGDLGGVNAPELDQMSAQPVGPYPSDIFDTGLWHRFTYQLKSHTAIGNYDGCMKMWVDGTKILDLSLSAVGVTPPGGGKPWCTMDELQYGIPVQDGVGSVRIGEAQTTNTPAWTLDFDDFTWRYA